MGMGLADDHSPRLPQLVDHRRVVVRDEAFEHPGPAFGRGVGRVADVLDRDRNAMEGAPPCSAPRELGVGFASGGERRLGHHRHKGVNERLRPLDLAQGRLGQLAGGDLMARKQVACFAQRLLDQVLAHLSHLGSVTTTGSTSVRSSASTAANAVL